MRRYGYFLLIIPLIKSLSAFVEAQQSLDRREHSEFMTKARTNDLLYINDTVVYLMNKSPLEAFPGYKDIYASYNLSKPISWTWIPYGAEVMRHPEATYQAIWCLRDSALYLSDIVFFQVYFCEYKSTFPYDEQYKLMEKLTGVEFDENQSPLSGNPFRHRNTIGMMPATWSSDTILIKMSRGQYLGGQGRWISLYCPDLNDTIRIKRSAPTMELDKWRKTPSEELVFKNGKLISKKTTDIY